MKGWNGLWDGYECRREAGGGNPYKTNTNRLAASVTISEHAH